ncbi:MAG: flagellar hook-length control protein FliK [Alphaproteobacteria bacterium]|nr:flagellar hook-length control protein FliK [Alphaproteobacteria bacterium]
MITANLLQNQLLGDATPKGTGKKNAAADDLLLTGQGGYNSFQTMLSGLNVSPLMAAQAIGKILATAAAETKGTGNILPETVSSVDLITALKSLTPEQLAALNIDADKLAGDFAASAAGETNTLSILKSLSTFDIASGETPETFTVVDDPKLAAALSALATQLKAVQVQNGSVIANTDIETQTSIMLAQMSGKPVILTTENVEDVIQKIQSGQQTITIANVDGDGFQTLKKLAFADIAPFLTQPRTVRIDSKSVMKVAQGPSFLQDGQIDDTALTSIAGLVPVFVKAQDGTLKPMLADGAALAKIAAQTSGLSLTTAQHAAALVQLQAASQQATNAAGVATDGTATAPLVDAAQGKNFAAMLQGAATSGTHANGATPLMVTVTPANAASRGFESVATGLDNGLSDPATFDLSTVFDDALRIHADQTLPANSSTALIASRGASQMHPSTHLVSIALQRAGQEAANGQLGERQFVIQLDPPNMGRLKIMLDFANNNTVKAKLLAERPETVSMLQKDSATLEKALQDSGFDTSATGAITFDLADNNSFSQNSGGGSGQQNGGSKDNSEDGTDFATIENMMAMFYDPETGLTHVNIII